MVAAVEPTTHCRYASEFDEIDRDRPLFSGISVTARVDTGYRPAIRGQAALATEAAR